MQALDTAPPKEAALPVPTEVLNEDIRDLRDSNQRLTAAVQDLGRSLNARIDDNHREFVTFRIEVVEKLGSLNSKVETIRGDIRTEVADKLGDLNSKLEAFRGDIRAEVETIRGDIRAEVETIRGDIRTEVESIRGDIRTEVADKLGTLNTNLEALRGDFREFRSTVTSAISVAKWGVGIATPIIIALIGFAFWMAFQAGRLDIRMSQLESRAGISANTPGR
jgi:hypothetical protein